MLHKLSPLTPEIAIKTCAAIPQDALIRYDSYMYSPVYYLFTGRFGGWMYQDDNGVSDCILTHPNKAGARVILPAFDTKSGAICPRVSQDIMYALNDEYPNEDVSLGRYPEAYKEEINQANFQAVPEDLLDWLYPTRILSTSDVYNLYGKGFQQVRQRLNQLDKTHLKTDLIQIKHDRQELLDVVYGWACQHGGENYTYDDLTGPSNALLELMKNADLRLYGQKILYKGRIKAFCIYEAANNIIANEFAISADKNMPGLSELQTYEMCKRLHAAGIKYVNLGGSETLGLDRFKKKFSPIISHRLQTYKLKMK